MAGLRDGCRSRSMPMRPASVTPGRWWMRVLIVAAALLASAFVAGGVAAAQLRFTATPHDARLVRAKVPGAPIRAHGGPVRVAVKVREPVARLSVRVNGKPFPKSGITRRSKLRWSVSVPARLLVGGVNRVEVGARRGRRTGRAFAEFRYLHRRRGLVRVVSPDAGTGLRSRLSARLSLARGADVRAWLNGRSVAGELAPAQRRLTRHRAIVRFDVGAAHGLRFGSNRLVVQAERDRFYTRVVRSVRVTRGGPLIGAGASRSTTERRAVRLGSKAMRAARGGALRYHWRLLSAPRGSRARLSDVSAARPWLRPDVRGVYRLRLRVREVGGAARRAAAAASGAVAIENVTVSTNPQGPLVRIETEVTQSGQVGILLGGTFVPAPPTPVQVFVLDRHTLATPSVGQGTVAGFSDMGQIGPYITQKSNALGSPPIVIIQTTRLGSTAGDQQAVLNGALGQIGALPANWGDRPGAGEIWPPWPFVAVGVTGLSPGSATQSCVAHDNPDPPPTPTRCVVDGWFSSPTGPSSHYTFSSGDYVPFDITPTPSDVAGLDNTITVGAQKISAPPFPARSAGGFHVVVLDRYTLEVLHNDSFATADDDDQNALTGMLGRLTDAVNDPSQMVMMTSVGWTSPDLNPQDPTLWVGIMNAIDDLGGTPDTFANATPPATYSFVGMAGLVDYGRVAEASSIAQAAGAPAVSGKITGVLERTNERLFEPLVASPSNIDTTLYPAIYQPPTPWPHSEAPDYAAASVYLAQQLLGADTEYLNVRDAYGSSTATPSWSGGPLTRLDSITYPHHSAAQVHRSDVRPTSRTTMPERPGRAPSSESSRWSTASTPSSRRRSRRRSPTRRCRTTSAFRTSRPTSTTP